jgi:hypothetical protein
VSDPARASSSTPDGTARDRAARTGAAVVRWVRQNPPGGRWRTWFFTADDSADAIGPRVDDLHLTPGTPTEFAPLEATVRRTSGIRSTGRGLALAMPASLDGDRVRPRRSGADPLPRARALLAVIVQLDTPDGHAVLLDADDEADRPWVASVTFPGPDVVPAFLHRAVFGDTPVTESDLPGAGRLWVQGWVASVVEASIAHGSASTAVRRALAAAPAPDALERATLATVHEQVVTGALPGLTPEEARWCGPALTARVAAGAWGRLPELLRYADEHWPELGATLAERTRDLLMTSA